MAKMAQNWNNVLSYIKIELGAPIQSIELTDDQIISYLEEHVLQRFSEEFPVNKWIMIDPSNKLDTDKDINQGAAYVQWSYKLPLDDINVESIHEVYATVGGSLGSVAGGTGSVWNYNPVDQLLQHGYNEIHNELKAIQSNWLIPPNIIAFELNPFGNSSTSAIIIEVSGHYTTLNQITADMYQLFKDTCLVAILKLIRTYRSRYNTIETPAGTIGLNIQYIESRIQELESVVAEKTANIPPRVLLDWLD